MPYVYNQSKNGLDFVAGSGGFLPGGGSTPGGQFFTWTVANGATAVAGNGLGILVKSDPFLSLILNFNSENTQRNARIVGGGTGLWKLQLFNGQTVQFGDELVTTSIEATNSGDSIELVAFTQKDWRVTGCLGNLNIT